MTRRLILVLLGAAAVGALLVAPSDARPPRRSPAIDRDYLAGAIVREHESPDPVNRFFDLTVANDTDPESNGGVPHIGILTRKDSRMADWLHDHDGKRIAVSLRGGNPLTRDGDER